MSQDLEELLQRGYRFAVSLTHDAMMAEDILHDAVTAMLERNSPMHKGYLFKSIRNRYIDRHRRHGFSVIGDENVPDHSDAGVSDPEARGIWLEDVDLALGRLRPEEREALYLHVVEGYTVSETAQLTERPLGTVSSLIQRARARLKALAEEQRQEAANDG